MRRPVLPGDPFWGVLVRDAQAWDMNPRAFALVMMAESGGIDPSALHGDPSKPGGAVGINQLTNFDNFAPLSRDEYLALDASGQWEHAVRKFFDGVIKAHPGVKSGGARDLYWLNFAPATYKPGTPDDAAIIVPGVNYGTAASPMMGEWIIRDNPAFVLPADKDAPVIRPAGLVAFLAKSSQGANADRWAEVLDAIDAAEKDTGVAWNWPSTLPSAGVPAPAPARAQAASMGGPVLLIGLLGLVAWRSRKTRRRV